MLKQTFLASFQILLHLHPYSCLQQNEMHTRYNININQIIYNLNKNSIDDKLVQGTICTVKPRNTRYPNARIFYYAQFFAHFLLFQLPYDAYYCGINS